MKRADVQPWYVYFVPDAPQVKPIPKDKFIVVAYIAQHPMGFFINSRINKWLQARPHLLVCEPVIKAAEHSFLKYDSHVDCQIIYEFPVVNIHSTRGEISLQAKKDILKAVQICPVLEQKHKKIILANNQSLLE